MAFNSGRPTLFMGPETVKDGRLFLKHPLSIPTDSRLVNFCELQNWRAPMHHPFLIMPSSTSIPNLDEKIRRANEGIDEWLEYWDQYYDRLGLPKTHIMRESLITMSAGGLVYTNSLILNGVRSKRDIALLSEERHHFLTRGMKAAERIIATALRGRQYAAKFRYDINIAFVARFLIRMSSLIPEAANLRQVGRDVEQVAKILTNVPGFQFAQLLRGILRKARRKHVLPPASRAPSPVRNAAPLPGFTPSSASPSNFPPSATNSATGSDSLNFTNTTAGTAMAGTDSNLTSHLDFSYAEQLFNDSSATFGGGFNFDSNFDSNTIGPTVGAGSGAADQAFTFDAWYPFPPLETDVLPGGFGQPAAGQGPGQGQAHGQPPDSSPTGSVSFNTRPQGNWW
ncbi:hypothetical protein JCM24511_01389 [Saitozyma sp. JCM 24511]|nr:hypothetical protein JCM24511_01389 [Saitozyma sp. JCM 24511]